MRGNAVIAYDTGEIGEDMTFNNRIIAGSEEWCSLPNLGIPAIKVRVDSGAKTSSLHAFNIRSFKRKGAQWVRFEIHPIQNNRVTVIRCEAPILDQRMVKSSSGVADKRYVIATTLHLFGNSWDIEVTLTNRDTMGFRMLLGREAMHERILVDPSSSFHCGTLSKDEVNAKYGYVPEQIAGLNIGLLASNPNLYSNQRIIEAAEERGHRIQFLDIRQCYMRLDVENPQIFYRGGQTLNDLDAVIPRIRPNMTFYGCALVRQFESIGVFSLNSSRSISNSRDRLYTLQELIKNGLDIPTTGFANSPIATNDLIELVDGAPLVVKLLQDTQGQGVVLAETRKAAESVINAFKSVQANLLVQEFIKEADGKDLRLFVVKNRVVAAAERQSAEGDFRSSIHRGGTNAAIRISTAERQLALKAVKILGLSVAGVDIIRSRKGPLLLKVISSPELEGIEAATNKDIAGAMITAIEKRLHWNQRVELPAKETLD